jgi:hypothetical protein
LKEKIIGAGFFFGHRPHMMLALGSGFPVCGDPKKEEEGGETGFFPGFFSCWSSF